jgi:hypothetical protein
MNRESYKTKRKGQPKKVSKVTGAESRLASMAKERVYYAQPQMHEAYNTKIDWIKGVIPKAKEVAP